MTGVTLASEDTDDNDDRDAHDDHDAHDDYDDHDDHDKRGAGGKENWIDAELWMTFWVKIVINH